MTRMDKRVSVISISGKMQTPRDKPKAWFGCRHVQVVLMSLGFFCCYAIRVTTSVTLEAMTNATTANPEFEEFAWDDGVKNVILSSFFWGYICTQIPGSILALRWGAQKFFAIALMVCGVITLFIPPAAHYGGWEVVCAIRVITGLCQGTVLPTLHMLLSKWAPLEERGRLATFVYSGGWIGNVVCLLTSGALSASSIGWPSAFYVWGGVTTLCGIIFHVFGKESPAEHSSIPLDEKEYIEVSLGITETEEKLSTPWIPILTSIPVWALLIAQAAQNWGFWMLLTKIPSYTASALRFNIQESGLYTSLPYLSAWILSFPISYVSDMCIRKGIVTTQASRKICNSIGQWIPAAALIGLGYVSTDQPKLAVTILVIAVATNIAAYCGHNVNHMDLSPNFAGSLMGVTNSAANILSILAPLITGVFVTNPKDVLQWRNIFLLSAGIYIVGNTIFVIFGSAKIQKWNDPIREEKNPVIFQITDTSTGTVQINKDAEKGP